MRIAINGRVLIKNKLEGIGYFTFEVLKNLVKTYPDNDYLVLFDQKPDKELLIPGVEYRVIYPPARRPFLYYIWFEWMVPFYLNNWDAEIFLSFDGFCSLNTKVPTILCIHDLAYIHYPSHITPRALRYYQRFQKKFAQKADHLLTVSEFSKNDLITQYNIKPSTIEVVYNGSRFEKNKIIPADTILDQYNLTKNQYFIYTGSIHPRKNIKNLLASFNLFCDLNKDLPHRLVLVGRQAWMTDDLMTFAKNSPHAERILFTGYLEDKSLWTLLTQATALCYISSWEGFGVPLLDAMHAQTPIICSNTTSLPEVVGSAAILVNPENIANIEHAMTSLSKNQELRNNLIKIGLQQKTIYSWLNTSQKIYNTCNIVLNQNRHS